MKKGINKIALGGSVIAALATVFFMQWVGRATPAQMPDSMLQNQIKAVRESEARGEQRMTPADVEARNKYVQELQAEVNSRAGKSAAPKPEEAAGGIDAATKTTPTPAPVAGEAVGGAPGGAARGGAAGGELDRQIDQLEQSEFGGGMGGGMGRDDFGGGGMGGGMGRDDFGGGGMGGGMGRDDFGGGRADQDLRGGGDW